MSDDLMPSSSSNVERRKTSLVHKVVVAAVAVVAIVVAIHLAAWVVGTVMWVLRIILIVGVIGAAVWLGSKLLRKV